MHTGNRRSSERPIELLVAIGSLGTGGSEKQVSELITRLPRDRFRTTVLTFDAWSDAGSAHRDRLRAAGVALVSISPVTGPMPIRWTGTSARAVRAVRSSRPDIIYAWLDETAAILAPIARVWRIPCVVARRNIIGSTAERSHPWLGRAIMLAEGAALLVTANSDAVAEECVRRGHVPDRVRTVRNGHPPLQPLPPPTPEPPTVFGYVAQFRAEKGHHRLLDAVAGLSAGAWRVDLAGQGPLRSELEKRVVVEGLQDRVRLIGSISDVRAFWRERHVAMLLSDSEGLPNALLEAAFAGRPAIATLAGGTPEVVGPGGILTPLDDSDAVRTAMLSLINDPRRREELGRLAWEHVSGRYTMEGMVADHVAVLEEVYSLARSRSDVHLSGRALGGGRAA